MRTFFLTLAIASVIVLGCSSTTRDRLTRFFFEVSQSDLSTQAPSGDTTSKQAVPELVLPEPRFASSHPPYMERKCADCHNVSANARMRVRDDFLGQCQTCHADFYSERVGHPPVAERLCMVCHLPHRSTQKFLLVNPVFDVCVDCHDEPDELSEEAHSADNAEQCTACHDPHFGTSPLLKESYRKAHGDD